MSAGLYVLLALVLVLLVSFIGFYLWNLKKSHQVIETTDNKDLAVSFQKDIENSKEVLGVKIENLQKQVAESKETISKTIEKLTDINSRNDLFFNKNLTELTEKIQVLKTDLSKQDSDLKTDLSGQKNAINKSFSDVMTNLTILTESSKSLKTVEDKIKDLNNVFLNSNKTRGNLGEYVLGKLLSDLYGETQELWTEQYKLPDGNIVDALIKTGDDKEDIAIDSKFPLTNYNNFIKAEDKFAKDKFLKEFKRDLKTKVEEVAKYINKKNEISSAIMFIPSEDIFTFIYGEFQDDVITFALNKKVWITSPTTLSSILFVLDKHIKETKFNKNLEVIQTNLLKIKTDFDNWIKRWDIFKKDLTKMNTDVDNLDTTHKKITKKYEIIYKNQKLVPDEVEVANQDQPETEVPNYS